MGQARDLTRFVCANCSASVESSGRPRGWERYRGGDRGPWWCADCVIRLIEDVLAAMCQAYGRAEQRRRQPAQPASLQSRAPDHDTTDDTGDTTERWTA